MVWCDRPSDGKIDRLIAADSGRGIVGRSVVKIESILLRSGSLLFGWARFERR